MNLVLDDCDVAGIHAMIRALASIRCTSLKFDSQVSRKYDRHFADPQMLSLPRLGFLNMFSSSADIVLSPRLIPWVMRTLNKSNI